jgi:hypothetical protein
VHNRVSSLRSEDIYEEVTAARGLSRTVGASLHAVYNALVLARATFGLVELDPDEVRLVEE